MSFQAYLDALEDKTGQTPEQLLDLARARGFGPGTRATEVVAWLGDEYGVGRGHAMAFVHVLKNGPQISTEHVGTTGSHRDESTVLHLDGRANRPTA